MELEESILGCIIGDKENQKYIEQLSDDLFRNAVNLKTLQVLKKMYSSHTDINVVTVIDKLAINFDRESVTKYLLKLIETPVAYALIDTYIRKLKKQAKISQLKNITKNIQTQNDMEKFKAEAERLLDTIKDIENNEKSNMVIDITEVQDFDYKSVTRIKSDITNLDKMIGGFYLGELSVWTGRSGQGKSTLLSQLILETINQGYKVCAYSGELVNQQFKHWLNLQCAGLDHLEKFYDEVKCCDVWLPAKEALKKMSEWYKGKIYLYNNNFQNRKNEQANLINIFQNVVDTYNCKVFVVDNLMTARFNFKTSDDYYIQQSEFVGDLVAFAKKNNVHVHLVAHPKKVKGDLDKESVSGTMDITNRADNVFSVERAKEDITTVRILKNRSNGIQDQQVNLKFNARCKRFYPEKCDFSIYKKYGWEKTKAEPKDTLPF